MSLPKVRIHKIAWNGNCGEVCYADATGAADHLRALLGSFGFRFGTPVARSGDDGALQALPVVKRGCSLTELQDVCRNDPGVEIRTPLPGDRPREAVLLDSREDCPYAANAVTLRNGT
jgi:hypothetical protein